MHANKEHVFVRYHRKVAFTLLELLVSIAILTILLVMLFGLLGEATKVWTYGNQRSELYGTGRAVIELIGREASVAESIPPLTQGNFQQFPSQPFVINPPLPASVKLLKDSSGSPMDSLFFYAPLQISANGPLVCVGYFVTSDYQLHRVAVLASNSTYSMAAVNLPLCNMWQVNDQGTILGRSNKYALFVQPAWWLNSTSGKWLTTTAPTKTLADAVSDSSVCSTIAYRVLGLNFRPIGRDGHPFGESIPPQPSAILPSTSPSCTTGNSQNLPRAYNSAWFPVAEGLPTEVEVTLVLCESRAFTQVSSRALTVPTLTMPTDNSDTSLQTSLTHLQTNLATSGIKQYVILTKRFVLVRGNR